MEAQGEYLLFLDSDDWLEKNVLDKLNILNDHFQKLNSTVEIVCKEISKTNDYLHLLNTGIYCETQLTRSYSQESQRDINKT